MARVLWRALCALVFVALVGEWPLELDPVLYSGQWRSPFVALAPLFVPLPGIRLFAWQVVVIVLAPFCFSAPGAFRRRAKAMDLALLGGLAAIAVTFMWGQLRAGSAYDAYYQLWRLLAGLLLAAMLASVLRTAGDLRLLAHTIVVAALIRGSLCIYYYWAYVQGRIYPLPEYVINHDDALLSVAAILIVACWAISRNRAATWGAAALVSLHQLYAIVLNDRRIAWVELMLALVAIYALMGPSRWRGRLNQAALLATPVLLLYMVVGWGREGAIFAPIRALSSVGSGADSSSLARQEEVRNLLYTLAIAGNPVLGTGWGLPYHKETSTYSNFGESWRLAPYTPHNSLLALAVFGGFVGLLGVWLVMPVAAFLLARGYASMTHPVERTAAMVAVGLLPAYAAHAYGDIGLQSFTGNLFLAISLGLAAKLGATGKAPTRAPLRPGTD